MEPSRRPIPVARKAVFALTTAGACFLCAELGARLLLLFIGPGPVPLRVGWTADVDDYAHQLLNTVYLPDERLFFRLQPGLDLPQTPNPRIFDLRTNALGLRGPQPADPKPHDLYRIICIGDSCTFGSGADGDHTYPAQLQQRLSQLRPDRRFEVINAGVPGYTSYQARLWFESDGLRLDPDCLVLTLGYNDALPTYPSPQRPFRSQLQLTDREFAEARRRIGRLGITRLAQRLAGFATPAPDLNPTPSRRKRRVPVEEYRDNLRAMIELCSRNGARTALVAWPVEPQSRPDKPLDADNEVFATYQQAARSLAAESGALLVDLVPLAPRRPDLFIDHVHFAAPGYAVVADALGQSILPLLPPPL